MIFTNNNYASMPATNGSATAKRSISITRTQPNTTDGEVYGGIPQVLNDTYAPQKLIRACIVNTPSSGTVTKRDEEKISL